MTYRTYCGDSTANGWPDELSTFPYKLGDLDGRAVRLIYGGGTRTTAAPLAGTGDPALFTRE